MEIIVQRGRFKTINFKDTNIDCDMDATEGIYALKEDGKKDFTKQLGEDITDEALSTLISPLEDLFYYRERPFNSRALIEYAFEKLSENNRKELLGQLIKEYSE